jgi:hypothetical protein
VANTPDERRSAWKAGVVAIWCTLAALGTSVQGDMARLALISAKHYMSHDGQTTTLLQGEAALRSELGYREGRSGLHAPWRPVLAGDDSITPRQLAQYAADGTRSFQADLWADDSDLADYFRERADSIQPLEVGEVPTDLLDKTLHLKDPKLRAELFSEPLPVYELPWLPRMPNQQWEPRPGCEDYRPMGVPDLVDDVARTDMAEWYESAQKDNACLEKHGPACDRRDKPNTLVIGQDQFHYCAKGYIWDCRGRRECELLDFGADISTDFAIPNLRARFEGYPDQRLASNILEGVRLEADLELQIVLMPQLVSIGDGYHSVQKTVRELKGMGFYQFFSELPYAPIYIVSQGSRIKKLGVKKYRRTSNFSAPHKPVRDKAGITVIPINTASRCYEVPVWMTSDMRHLSSAATSQQIV